jgi:hypothetical protein
MKNIFVLPTDKPSILYTKDDNYKLSSRTIAIDWYISEGYKPQNIYITSDEEIKEGDWFLSDFNSFPIRNIKELSEREGTLGWKQEDLKNNLKIILTTDQDLIKDGVQAIDDESLEWFVKNPSCENIDFEIINDNIKWYKIIIAKEEPKQETLEEKLDKIVSKKPSKFWEESDKRFKYKEALEEASEYYAHNYFEMHETNSYKELKRGFTAGAKWQAKRMYSEEEVEHIFNIGQMTKNYGDYKPYTFKEAMEQFKKK